MDQTGESKSGRRTPSPSRFAGREGWALAALAGIYLCLGFAYRETIPLFEAPDEPSHIQYVGFVAKEKRLPAYAGAPDVPGEGMQPPLYYLLLAPLYPATVSDEAGVLEELRRASLSMYGFERGAIRQNRLLTRQRRAGPRVFNASPVLEPLRVLRWPSLCIGFMALLLTYGGVMAATRKPSYALLATSLLAFNPQFLFVTSTVSNDGMAVVVGAAALGLVARFLARAEEHEPRLYYLGLAVLAGLGVISKLSTLPVLAASALAIFIADPRPLRRRLASAASSAALFVLLASPYLVFNSLHRGDALGLGAIWASAAQLPGPDDFGGRVPYFINIYFPRLFASYWARFGWMNVLAPMGVQLIFGALCVFGVLGFARTRESGAPLRRYLAAAFGLSLLVHMALNLQTAQPQGRHLFAAAPHLAALLSLGLLYPVESMGPALSRRLALALSGSMVLVALYCLFFVIGPAYGSAPLP